MLNISVKKIKDGSSDYVLQVERSEFRLTLQEMAELKLSLERELLTSMLTKIGAQDANR